MSTASPPPISQKFGHAIISGFMLGSVMLCVAPAFAQSPAPQAAPDASNDIVVTARNREEKLQDVPLAITSFSSEALTKANVRNLRDVAYLTPGLSITSGGPNSASIPSFVARPT